MSIEAGQIDGNSDGNDHATTADHTMTDNTNDDMEIDLFDNAGWRSASNAIAKKPTSGDSQGVATPATTTSVTSLPVRGSTRGRGRGRGSARGARGARLSTGTPHVDSPNGVVVASPSSARGASRGKSRTRGTRRSSRGGRGGKRRRDSDEIKAEDSPSDAHPSDEEDGEEYTPQATATRSGRPVQKPSSFVPPPLPSPITGVKRKRHMHRKNPELSVCRVCLRPHSPLGNMIVFCDGCNTPYHRYCHRPTIQQVVVDEPDREWYCAECERENDYQYDVSLFKTSVNLSDEQKRSHLERVPQPVLIRLLISAAHAHPDIAIIPPDVHARANALSSMPPPPPQTNGHTSFSIPPVSRPTNGANHLTRPPDDELETGYESDPPSHYPIPGQGLAATLPPEQDHVHFLVDDNREVYTHLYQSDPKKANEGVYGPKISEEQRIADVARKAREAIEAKVAVEMKRAKLEAVESKRKLEEGGRRRDAESSEGSAATEETRGAAKVGGDDNADEDDAAEDLEMLDREIEGGLEVDGEGPTMEEMQEIMYKEVQPGLTDRAAVLDVAEQVQEPAGQVVEAENSTDAEGAEEGHEMDVEAPAEVVKAVAVEDGGDSVQQAAGSHGPEQSKEFQDDGKAEAADPVVERRSTSVNSIRSNIQVAD